MSEPDHKYVAKQYGNFRICTVENCGTKTWAKDHCLCRKHRSRYRNGTRKEYQNNYYKNNKELYKDLKLKEAYGISLSDYNKMLKDQNDRCKICFKIEVTKSLAVDHNHITKKIRGLLCENCNRALGLVKESINNLKNMIKYLENDI